MLEELAVKYGMKALGILLAIAIIVGGYYYIRHQGAVAQAKEDAVQLAERNAKEKTDSDAQWNAALQRLAAARQLDNTNYSKDLTQYAKISADSAAALERMRNQPRIPAAQGNRAAASRETDISPAGSGGIGEARCEVSDFERVEIAKMAELALIAAGHIRRTSDVR